MAGKYWWEDVDQDDNKQQSSGQTTSQDAKNQGYWWEDDSMATMVGNNINTRVNTWIKNHNNYISDYQKRYSGRKYNYEDAYVKDSARWLDTVSRQKSTFDAESKAILDYMDQYKDYLDEDWMKSIRETLTGASGAHSQIVDSATMDNEYWKKFTPNEDQTAAGYTPEKIYSEWQASSKQYDDDLAFDVEAGSLELARLTEKLKVGSQEVKELEDFYDDAFMVETWYTGYQMNPGAWTEEEINRNMVLYNTLKAKYGSIENLEKLISETKSAFTKSLTEERNRLEEQIERAKYVQGYEGYMGNMDAEDYAPNSQYESTRTGVAFEDATWGVYGEYIDKSKLFDGDFDYNYINRHPDALGVANVNDTQSLATFTGVDDSFLQTMSDDELGVFNYLYKTQSPEAAYEFIGFIASDLKQRKRLQEQEYWANEAKAHPVGTSVVSVLMSPLKSVTALGQVADYIDDGTIDENAGYNRFSYIPSSIRNQVASDIAKSGKWGEVGSWTYQLGMSMGDFLLNTAISGGNSTISLALMGSGAMADTVISAKDRGLDDDQAMILGVVAGAAEIVTEKFSLDALFKGGLEKGALRYILANAFTEGTEEVSSSLINLVTDVLVSKDKSEWNMAVQDYLEKHPDATESEAFQKVLGDNILSLGLDFLGGALMGGTMGSAGAGINYVANARPGIKENIDAVTKYGDFTSELIQEGLASDPNSRSYDLAQYYEKKTSKGKSLSGYEIRNLIEANEQQFVVENYEEALPLAKKMLEELGETKNIDKIAELVAKKVSGQELTASEKSTLVGSQYGAKVAKKLTPTKSDLAYKSLDKRVGTEGRFGVSESGKATIRATGEEIDISTLDFATVGDGQATFKVADGREVSAGDIDFADDNQSYMVSAVSDIENITPAAATAVVRDIVDMEKPLGPQLNGIDEAFTYGYYNYSEADLKAGNFTHQLTSKQMMSAYKLGQAARASNKTNKVQAVKHMRTAVQAATEKSIAEGKAAPKTKGMTITYNYGNGKLVSIEEAEIKTAKQEGGVAVANILHSMGLGTNVEFFSSYVKKDANGNKVRMFIDDNGVEQKAYTGVYRKSDGTIRIDLNAYNGRGLTLNALAHELTHFIQQWSPEKYEILVDFLIKTYEETDMTMNDRVLREQARLEGIRGEAVSYNEAFDEVVANAMSKMFDDGKLVERLTELKEQDESLARKLWEGFKKILAKFIGIYEKEGALFHDAADIVAMKETFEQLQNMFAEALVEASENYQTSLIAREVGLDIMPVESGVQYSYSSLAEAAGFVAVENDDGTRSFTRDGKKVSQVTIADIDNSPIGAFINFSLEMGDISEADAKRQKEMFAKICTMACKTNDFAMTMQFVGSAVFTGMKANADKQYGTTYDFPSICTKTQAVIDAMSAKMMSLGRGLTSDEIVKLYDDVFASGNPVPCPECYVFSRWIGIGGLLDNIKKYQDYYGDMAVEDVAAEYRKMKAEVSKFAEEQGISFGKAKGALTSKLTKEFNKLTEKIEKAENQGEKVKASDKQRLAELEPMMNTVKGMTWLENVYFADSSLKRVNPNFRVPNEVLFNLNNGEAFATKYKEAWAFRTTQGAGYGKAITPYAEARLGEGILVTNNTTNAIKGRAQGSLDNYFLRQMGKLDKQSRDALKRARLKQKIQAFLGGQRFQSTSDARYENASDYLLAALEMQAMRGMVQCYTKVDGAVPAFSAWGFSINQSLMPLNGGLDADGNVKDTPVGGMKPSVAFENRNKHETAGTITIGVNDNHIRAMFKQLVRDFIIPYHASGGKADVVAEFRRIQEGKEAKGKAVRSTDYSRTQSDKVLSDEVLRWQGKTDAQIQRIHEIRNARIAILTGGSPNMTVVRSNRFLSALYDKFNGGEWDGVKIAKSKVESQIFPNEFWDQTVTYDESVKITKDYLEYCEDLGFLHRFSGMVPSNGKLVAVSGYNENGERVQLTDLAYKYDENGNKTTEVEEFFWKVLTDRRMYDNNGNYLAQKVVTLNDTTTETVTGFAKNNQGREYDKAKAEALAKKIMGEQYSSQETDRDRQQYNAFREKFAKERLDQLSDKLGNLFPLSAGFEQAIQKDKTPVSNMTIVANSQKRGKGEDFYKAAKNAFRNVYGGKTTFSIKQLGINADADTSFANESMSKVSDRKDKQTILDLTPAFKQLIEESRLLAIERTKHNDNKEKSLLCYRLYNAYIREETYIDGNGNKQTHKVPHIVVFNVVQNLVGAKAHMVTDIKDVAISNGHNSSKLKYAAHANGNISIGNIADVYGVVKSIDRKKGGLRYSSGEMSYKFDYSQKENGEVYSSQETDADYMKAVNSGYIALAQEMVLQAAYEAGHRYAGLHGTQSFGFTKFDRKKTNKHGAHYVTDKYRIAESYSGVKGKTSISSKEARGNYFVTVDMKKPLVVECHGSLWNNIPFDIGKNGSGKDGKVITDDIVKYAEKKGYDGVIFKNLVDPGHLTQAEKIEILHTDEGRKKWTSNVYAVFNSNQIKSLDPVTYDDKGKVIPLSERFNRKKDDIRYSSQETDLDSNGKKLGEDQLEYFEKSNVRDRNGRLQVVYHGGTVEFEFDTTRGGKGATQYGPGAYFTDSEYYAKEYTWYRGGNVKDYYLNIEKMFDDTNMDATVQMPQWKKLEHILRSNGIEDKFINKFKEGGFAYMSRYLALKAGAKTSSSWEGSEQLNAMLREAGFDGIKGELNDVYQYVIFTPNQAKLTTNEVPSTFYDTRYSGHDTDYSNRSLLANAFEGITKNSDEYKMIQEYKGHIRLLNEYEEKLDKLNAEIREIRFTSGKYDAEKLHELEAEAKEIAGHINRHDRKLLQMEASGPLRKVIEQERKKEAQKTKDHVKEIQQNKKLRAEQTELRHKIRKAIRDLDKILNRGNKKLNVKEDMRGFVSKALELADYLFTDHISNDDLIRNGITVRMTPREAALVKETEDILSKLYDNADSLTDEEFTRLDAKRKANEDKLRDLLTAQRNERLNTPVYNLFNDLVTEYAKLNNSKQAGVKDAYDPNVERFLRSYIGESNGQTDSDRVTLLRNMRVADMTTEELWKLHNAYKMVLHSVRTANQLFVKGKTESIEEMAGRIANDFSNRKIQDKKLMITAQKLFNKLGWDYEKLHYALDRIGSEAFTELFMNLAESENIVMQDVIEAAAFRDEMVKKYGFNNWDVNKKIDREFIDNTGKKFKLTLGELMSLYAYSRREGAWDHIEYGGFAFGKEELTDPNPADTYKLSKEQCEAITNLLTKDQKDYVEDMQKFLSETMGEKGNEVSMQLYGIKMFGEKNYFPLHIYGVFKAQAQESEAKAAEGFTSMSNAGFTHAQNPNAKAPFVLEGFNEVWSDHVNEMSRYHGTVPALEDIRRVMNRSFYSESSADSTAIKQLMINKFGKDAANYFDNLYREANSGAITDKLQKTSKKLLSLFRKNSVAYKLSVLVQQPTSIIRAYSMIDKKYFGLKGFGAITSGVVKTVADKFNWTKAHTNAYNEMLKYAPGVTMAKEIGGFDTATGRSIRSYLLDTNKTLKQKWKTGTVLEKGKAVLDLVDDNAIANLPNLADKIAWIEIWNACKRETVAKHKDLAPNSEEFMQIVGDRFTEVIRATQVYDSIFAKSPMLKSKHLSVQYLVSFMNEPNTVANMAESAVRDATRGDWKSGARKAVVLVYATLAVGLVKSVVYAIHDDDEDETYAEKYIEALVGSLVSDFNPLSYIPIARDVSSALQGYDIERPDVAIIVDAIEALQAKYNNANKDTENMTEAQLAEFEEKVDEATWKVVGSVATFLGIPVKNIRKDVMGIYNTVFNKTEMDTTMLSLTHTIEAALNDSQYFFFRGDSKSKQDKLYDAIISGDTAYADRLKSTYKTDDAYHSAIRKALRENDPRIKEAAQARYDGKTEEYKRIFREIQNEGKFTFDDIMSAINTELSKLTPDKATSDYSASDFVESIVLGDTKSAQAIKDDIIATKVANGKTQEEAEKEFVSNIASGIRDAYSSGLLDKTGAENMLMEYADMDEEDAVSRVGYWSFIEDHQEYKNDLSESNVNDYQEFAEPAEIPLAVFVQYVKGTKGLVTIKDEWGDVEISKQDQFIEVIDSLPLTWQQKDALFLTEYAESSLWKVSW